VTNAPARSITWSTDSRVSWSSGERRPETEGRLGLVGMNAAQQTNDNLKRSEVASERGKGIDVGERARGA
jgi:hypothetical protein